MGGLCPNNAEMKGRGMMEEIAGKPLKHFQVLFLWEEGATPVRGSYNPPSIWTQVS